MNSLRHIAFIIVVLLLSGFALCAVEQKGIHLTARVDRDTVRIGDIITYTVEVEWSSGISIIDTTVGENFGKFSLVEAKPAVDKMGAEEKQARIYSYEVAAYESGEFEIPPFTIRYREQDGIEKSAESLPVKISVVSVLPEKAENLELRPLKHQADIPPDYSRLYRLLAFATGAFALLLGVFMFIRTYLQRRKLEEYKPAEPLRPAEVVAREQLIALRNSSLLAEGNVKEYFSRVADIIREYTGRRCSISALDMTTFELMYTLNQSADRDFLSGDVISRLQAFLEECDLVKFAKFIPPRERWDAVIDEALGIVDATTLRTQAEVSVDVSA